MVNKHKLYALTRSRDFLRADASAETLETSATDLSTRLDFHSGKRLRQFFSRLIRKIYSRCSRNMSKDIENSG